MIRLCRKVIRKINVAEIHSLQNSEFFEQYKNDGITVIYEHKKVKGIVTYKDFAEHGLDRAEVQNGKVVVGDYIWNEAHRLLNRDKDRIFLPVIDEQEDVLGFCYDNGKKSYLYYAIDKILDYYESDEGNGYFIQDLYPQVKQVKIHGLNEWSYRLYKILRKRKIEVVVEGGFLEIF